MIRRQSEVGVRKKTGIANVSAPEAEKPAERRRSMPAACSKCVSKRACPLARSHWFQSIKTLKICSRNVTLARQGDPSKRIYVLKRGWMQIMHVLPNGKSVVDLCGPGWVMGIASAMTAEPHIYSAVTLEECEIEEAASDEVLKHLKRDVFLTSDMLRYISRQSIRVLRHFYDATAKVPTEERMRRVLVEIARTCGVRVDEGVRINLSLSAQVIADWIGCSRQWASKLLSDLEFCGALKRNNGWITLPDAHPDPARCRRFPGNPRCKLVDTPS